MSYPYEDIDETQFERLVVECARKLFGISVQSFSPGPDGGRDARFDGTAEQFPSTSSPWTGLTIIQAKHTYDINVHFSDPSFSSEAETSVLSKEISRIKRLVDDDNIKNYILFSNRRLGGNASEKILNRISQEVNLPKANIYLAGTEYLNTLMHRHKDLIELSRIDPAEGPLLVSSQEIAEVILSIAEVLEKPLPDMDTPVMDRVSYDQKNEINGMTPSFAAEIERRYLVYTPEIEKFLAHPANRDAQLRYDGAVEEFQLKIIARRDRYPNFDELFNNLIDLLIRRDGVLARHKRLLRAMVFYMYWHCDIGERNNAGS